MAKTPVTVHEHGMLLMKAFPLEVGFNTWDLTSEGYDKLKERVDKFLQINKQKKDGNKIVNTLSNHLPNIRWSPTTDQSTIKTKQEELRGCTPSERTRVLYSFQKFLKKKVPYEVLENVVKELKRKLGEGGQTTLDQLVENDDTIKDIIRLIRNVSFTQEWHHVRLLMDIVGRKLVHDAAQNNGNKNVAAGGPEGRPPQAHDNAHNDDAAEFNDDESFDGNNDDAAEFNNDMIPFDGNNDDSFEFNNDMIPFDGNNHMISVDGDGDDDDDDLSHNDNNREGESDDDDADNSNGKDEGAVEEDQQSTTTVHEFWDLDEFSDVFESNEGLEDAAYELFKGDNINDQDQVRELFEEFNAVSNSDISLETFFWHLKIMKEMKALESAVEDAEETARDAEKAARDAEKAARDAEERAQRAEERAQRAERKAKDAKELADLHKLGEELAKKKLALAEESAQDWEKTAQDWEKCGEGILRELRKEGPEFFATAHDQDLGNNSTHMTAEGLQLPVENLQLEQGSLASNAKTIDVIEQLVREASIRDAEVVRVKVSNNEARLGQFVGKDWRDGHELCKVKKERQALKERKKKLEQELEAQRVVKAQPQQITFGGRTEVDPSQHQASESENRLKGLLGDVEREDDELYYKWRALLSEKQAHIRASKRVKSEDSSKLRFGQKLGNNENKNKYVLMHILGKGGSSEVWRAFDLERMEQVAIKIQENGSSWSEECKIHRDLKHKNIMPFFDSFQTQIDAKYTVFAIVLECCNGLSLAEKMENGRVVLPERDGLAILNQILSGTKYLSQNGIIHFDLKPGNIVFDEKGNAKITDFGLSKNSDADGMITNHGVGTFCYMAPECFSDDENVRVSNKVDVWAVGVMFYQLLFGKVPFGHGIMELAEFLEKQTKLHAEEVKFPDKPTISKDAANPPKPAISDGAKAFIRYCLIRDQNDRPTMNQLCEHDYLKSSL